MSKPLFNVRVYGLLLNDNQEVLLSDEEEFGKRFTKFPGGGLEYGEGLIEGLKREFLEECNLVVEVEKHFYTTDFFVESVFGGGQLISVYYLVKPQQSIDFKISSLPFDFEVQNAAAKQSFRFISINELGEEHVTFPIDKHVVKLLRKKFNII
ncbi:NUDIX hydrolase [Pelobium sp.]|nr:NUDIX hydrolase [Pelobium sp.]MDA9554879.1 NUDIX hydrolase [Pelobium sp.]